MIRFLMQLLAISHQATPWYVDLVNFKVCAVLSSTLSHLQRKNFLFNAKYYVWEESLLYKLCGDGFYRRCLLKDKVQRVLHHCHASTYDGHFGAEKTVARPFKWVFIGPTCSKMQGTLL